jgi:flagellar biosynthesis component FlhA
LLAFARCVSRPSITYGAAQWGGNIVAYLLDPRLEDDAVAAEATETEEDDEDVRRSVVAALETELAALPHTSTPPVLLTTSRARLPIWRAVQATWPRLTVLTYDELDAMANVMPVARLGSTTS